MYIFNFQGIITPDNILLILIKLFVNKHSNWKKLYEICFKNYLKKLNCTQFCKD